MTQDENWLLEQFQKKYEEQAARIGRFNLAIFGKTGVGKSSLINAIFGENVAPTGIGEPVTMTEHLYVHRDGALGVIDTRGLEIGVDTDTLIGELGTYMEAMRHKPLSEQIHVAWYCVRATDRRFEETEAEFIRRLHELGLPVIVVLTQVPSRGGEHHADAIELAEHIASLNLPIAGGRPVLVMAHGDEFTGQVQHGLKDLLDATFRVAPEGVEAALVAAQKIDLARKRKQAAGAIAAAVTGAAGVGAVPIPIADAVLLVPVQIGMMAGISAIYGIDMKTSGLATLAATTAATGAGRAAVTGLLKIIPGAGSIIGGVVSAGTAGVLTGAIGWAWVSVCDQLSQGKLKGVNGLVDNEAIRKLFQGEFLKYFSRMRSKDKKVDVTVDPELEK